VLRLMILEKLEQVKDIKREAQAVVDTFAPVSQLGEFELGWLAVVARLAGRDDVVDTVRQKRAARALKDEVAQIGVPPTLAKD
jgi:hypothetical protein